MTASDAVDGSDLPASQCAVVCSLPKSSECLFLAISGLFWDVRQTSAVAPKADIGGTANLRTQKADIGARFGEGTLLFNSLHRLQGSPYMGSRLGEAPARSGRGRRPQVES